MNKEDLFEAINGIDEKYVEVAEKYKRKKKTAVWMKWAATAACLCLVVGTVTIVTNNTVDRGAGDPVPGGSVQESGEEKQIIDGEPIPAREDFSSDEDQPVQNDVVINKTYDDIWGGSYIDESGRWVVWLTENTPEAQKMIFDNNPEFEEDNVIFKKADFSLAYLNELLDMINDGMSDGKLYFVTGAMVSEQTNRVEAFVNTNDEKLINKFKSYGKEGAITIKYSDSEGSEDLGKLN